MTKVSLKAGTEGSRHDPYHFTEVTVDRLGRKFAAHTGLVQWYKIDGQPVPLDEWVKQAGARPEHFERWKYQGKDRQVNRHLKTCPGRIQCDAVQGFNGESLTVCGCGKVLDYSFCRSAVE